MRLFLHSNSFKFGWSMEAERNHCLLALPVLDGCSRNDPDGVCGDGVDNVGNLLLLHFLSDEFVRAHETDQIQVRGGSQAHSVIDEQMINLTSLIKNTLFLPFILVLLLPTLCLQR